MCDSTKTKAQLIEELRALRRSEGLLRTAMNATQEAMISIGEDGLITLFNPAAERMFGRKKDDVLGQSLDYLMPEEYRERHAKYVKSYFATGKPNDAVGQIVELPGLRSDGTVFPMEISLSAGDVNGKRFVIAVSRDITERKRAEERLRLLSSAVEQSSEGIAVSDLEGNLLFVNNAFATMHGYTLKELSGKHLSVFHSPEQMSSVEASTRQVQETGAFSGELWHTRRDGTLFPTLMHNSLIRDEEGNPKGMIGTVLDITERKQAEEALRESERRFQQIVENVQEWIWEVDADGLYTYANPTVEKVLGYKPEEIVGNKHFYDVFHPEDREELKKAAIEVFARGEPFRGFTNRNVHKNGKTVWLSTSGVPILDEKGNICGYRGADIDITERKRAEQELAEYREHLEELVERRTSELEASRKQLLQSERLASIGTLAAGIAHEINNPVGGTLLAAQNALNLKGKPDTAGIVETCLRDIVKNAKRCAQIVQGVLQFSKQERSGKWPSDLNAIIQHAAVLTKRYAQEHGGIIKLNLDDDLPEILLNPLEVEQVFVNLIRNAVEAGAGAIRVLICTKQTSESLRITVQDNGTGIPQEQTKHIFDPFFTTGRERGGTGLGLSIAHGIITEHGGTIDVQSRPGETMFIIDLPLASAEAREV